MASIKEAIGRERYKHQNLSGKILFNKKSITITRSIAENFNKYFTQILLNLAKDIGTSAKSFDKYVKKHGTN